MYAFLSRKTHPSRHDDQSSVSVSLYGGNVWPVLVDSVLENWSGVVTNNVEDTIVHPSLDHITVVKTGDGWWNKTVWRKVKRGVDRSLVHPGSIEYNLLVGIGKCCIVQ